MTNDPKNQPLGGAGFNWKPVSTPTENPVVKMPRRTRAPRWKGNFKTYRDESIVVHDHDHSGCEICR